MCKTHILTALVGTFLLVAIAAQGLPRSRDSDACVSELGADLSSIAIFTFALEKLEDGDPAKAVEILELGLSLKARRAETIARTGVTLEGPTPHFQEGVERALSYARIRDLDNETRASLRYRRDFFKRD